MATFNIKQNDTSPAILYALTPTDVDLTSANVVFRYRTIGTETWTERNAVIVTETITPTVRYDWQSADTATPGFYEAEFVVTYADSTVETFPNSEFITINIVGDETGLSERINNVRFLVGDTDSSDYAITNDNVSFALTQAGDDVYLAAAICARALAGKYATYVDTKFEDVSSDYSQMSENYYKLATRLEAQSKKYGSRGLGTPVAGGLTYSDIEANDLNDDRVQPKFKQDQFANPPRGYDPDIYGY
jgi:hypothetical protein